jgi:hypothetical protein
MSEARARMMTASTSLREAKFQNWFGTVFFALALLCVAPPGFASVKALAILLAWTYWVINDNFNLTSVIWFLSILLNLVVGAAVGSMFHAVVRADVMNHFFRLLIFFVVLSVGGYVSQRCRLSQTYLDNLIFSIAVLMMLFKVFIAVCGLTGWIPVDKIESAIGLESVTADIGFGLSRLQFPSDIIIPFLIATYTGGRSKTKDCILLMSASIVILLSFSRYLFAFYLLCIFIRAIWVKKIDLISILSIGVVAVAGIVLFNSLIGRFASDETQSSDDVRIEQVQYLKRAIADYPIMGTGVGSSISTFKRSEATPYFYEAQWYAMTMQLGYFGIIWFFGNLLGMLYACLKRGNKLFFFIVFIAWFASGLTNPYVTALGSAFGLCILLFRSNRLADAQLPRPAFNAVI